MSTNTIGVEKRRIDALRRRRQVKAKPAEKARQQRRRPANRACGPKQEEGRSHRINQTRQRGNHGGDHYGHGLAGSRRLRLRQHLRQQGR
jgi:hypothetical protein